MLEKLCASDAQHSSIRILGIEASCVRPSPARCAMFSLFAHQVLASLYICGAVPQLGNIRSHAYLHQVGGGAAVMHAIAADSKERRKKYPKSPVKAKKFDRLGHALSAPMKCYIYVPKIKSKVETGDQDRKFRIACRGGRRPVVPVEAKLARAACICYQIILHGSDVALTCCLMNTAFACNAGGGSSLHTNKA